MLLKSKTIPKTTSGKIARSWCRRAYLENKLQIVKSFVNTGSNQRKIDDVVSEGVELEGMGTETNKKYQLVSTTADQQNNQSSEAKQIPLGDDENDNMIEMKSNQYTVEELRNMEIIKIELLLEEKLIQIVKSQGGNNLVSPLNRNQNLAAFGLDSMLITQFKGVLENR